MNIEHKYSYKKEDIVSDSFSVQWFKLGHTRTPLIQPWQQELAEYRKTHPRLCLPAPVIKKENYMKFSNAAAAVIAKIINPVIFCLLFVAVALLLAFNKIDFWLWWVGIVVVAIPFVMSATAVLKQCIYEIRVKQHENEIETNIYVDNTEGAPGAGKTSSVINDAKILADIRWADICHEYALLKPFMESIPNWPKQQREDAMEIIETYEYYQTSGTYPCLWTSFAVFVDGVPANQFTVEHILQRKRIPYGSVIAIDEFNLFIPQNNI